MTRPSLTLRREWVHGWLLLMPALVLAALAWLGGPEALL